MSRVISSLGLLLLAGCLAGKDQPQCQDSLCPDGYTCDTGWGGCLDSCYGDDKCQSGWFCCDYEDVDRRACTSRQQDTCVEKSSGRE